VLARLSRLRYKDLEATFDRELREAEEEAKRIPSLSPRRELPAADELADYDRVFRLVPISPRAAITEAWREVELATAKAAASSGIDVGSHHIAGTRHMRLLSAQDVVPPEVLGVYDRLRRLRNGAAHAADFDIDVQEAERYVDIALGLARRLNSIGNANDERHRSP